jgi:outer membrane protein OmpA-like peptidoglycan-associated protein
VVEPAPVRDTVVPPPPPVRVEPPTPSELRGVPSMVHFALDRHDLSPASRSVLAALVDSLRAFPTVKVVLEGHTDLRASVAYNLALSRRRTQSVQAYLQQLGIDPGRISIVAQGKSQLVKTGTDVLSHARNRRVQLRYFKEDGSELEATQLLDDLQLEGPRVRRARPVRR